MIRTSISVLFSAAVILLPPFAAAAQKFLPWSQCLSQKPEWYGCSDAIRIADQVLLYQRLSGGWDKNIDMARPLSDQEASTIREKKSDSKATIDNGATYTQMAYLARVFTSSKQERFKVSFLKALDYLLLAQYPNGGWPQFYPNPTGYQTHITFNDNAMTGVLELFRE